VAIFDGFHLQFPLFGQKRTFPKLSGMSGSPVWLLYDENGAHDFDTPVVVGVFIEHPKGQRALIATDIDYALKAMDDA
jgi:hypothetical protein